MTDDQGYDTNVMVTMSSFFHHSLLITYYDLSRISSTVHFTQSFGFWIVFCGPFPGFLALFLLDISLSVFGSTAWYFRRFLNISGNILS